MDDRATYLPNPGTLIGGKYRVEGPIGEGGMAVVLAATHEGLRPRVAVKVLQPKYAASRELRERFFREARALAALHHVEHITRVFDVGTLESGAAYLVLEHLDGYDLHEALQKGGPMPWRRAVGYMVQVCEGLGAAHAHGVLHRDLKPSNMFLVQRAEGPGSSKGSPSSRDGNGLIKLLDFGLAKLKEEGVSSLTGAEAVMGSPSYMAPEQIKGLTNADERSDIWSVGVSLYELLADGYPFEADTAMKIAAAVIVEKPKPLAARAANLPPGLEDVVMGCLVKDPEKRTRSAEDLLGKLAPFMTMKGHDATPATRARRALPTSRGEPTYGGMMEDAEGTTNDGVATLVRIDDTQPSKPPPPLVLGSPEADDDDGGTRDLPTLEKAPSAKEALAARAVENAKAKDRKAEAPEVAAPGESKPSDQDAPGNDGAPNPLAKTLRAPLPASDATLREARPRYFEENRFGADGGYEKAWVDYKLGPIPFPFPNTRARKRAVKVHDLHHVMTGYATDIVGDFEIAAWEIGAGCKGFVVAWQLNLGGMFGGLVIAPRRTFRAFVRGRHSESLYGKDTDALLDDPLTSARMMMGIDAASKTRAGFLDVFLFVVAETAGLFVAIFSFAIGLFLLPFGLLAMAFGPKTTRVSA